MDLERLVHHLSLDARNHVGYTYVAWRELVEDFRVEADSFLCLAFAEVLVRPEHSIFWAVLSMDEA